MVRHTKPNGTVKVLFIPSGSPQSFRFDDNTTNRASNPHYAKYGILKSMENPYGLTTKFTYEGNKAFKDLEGNSSDKFVGGLRIKEIKSVDRNGQTKRIRRFGYGYTEVPSEGSNHSSSVKYGVGIARKFVTLDDYCSMKQQKVYSVENGETCSRIRVWGSTPLSQICFYDGTNVIYSKVIESIGQGAGSTIKKIYYYENPDEDKYKKYKRSKKTPFHIKTECDSKERGLLVCLESYRDGILTLRKKYKNEETRDTKL